MSFEFPYLPPALYLILGWLPVLGLGGLALGVKLALRDFEHD